MSDVDEKDRPVNIGNPQMGWASDVAAEMLRRMGIKYLSMNPGASYRGFHDSIVNYLGNEAPQMLLCLHEDHAVHVAQGYAKATDEPMGCILHSNVGLMHGMMGMFNAWCNRVPMVVMGATGPVDAPLRRPWIDWIHTAKDQGALVRNFVKYDDEPRSAAALVETMLRVNQVIRTAPQGPAYVCLDAGLQEDSIDSDLQLPDIARFAIAAPPQPTADDVERAADMLVNAKSVVMMCGRLKRSRDNWDKRVKLAELLGAGVCTDMKVGAAFPTDHALHLAPPAGRLRDEAVDALSNADLILDLNWLDLAGTFKLAIGREAPKAKVIRASAEPYIHNGFTMDHMGLPVTDLQVLCEAEEFVNALLPAVEKRLGGKSRWDGNNKGRENDPFKSLKDLDPNDEITPETLTIGFNEARGTRQVTLGNVTIGWSPDAYHFTDPMDYLGNDGGGGLSSGTGTAIGMGLALKDSDRLAVSILGDGDTMQGSSALWTAAHYDIPVMIIISNNRSNFNDEIHQEVVAKDRDRPVENRWIGMRITEPDIDISGYAKSLGVASAGPITKLGELIPAIEEGFKVIQSGTPYVRDIHVKPGYAAHPPRRSA
ncbi:MAG: thiamine pyrophosphate-binding protein [Alphaproteobacteria bacterium]